MSITCIGFLVFFECQMPPPPPPVVVCPPLTRWASDYQARLAREMAALPSGSALSWAMQEHLRLRDQIRKCRAAKK